MVAALAVPSFFESCLLRVLRTLGPRSRARCDGMTVLRLSVPAAAARIAGVAMSALTLVACDRVVHVSGRVRGEGGAATGTCKGLLHDPCQWGGRSREVPLPNEFDQVVFVDPLRRPRYTFIISCEQCSGTVRSPEFVSGRANLGVMMVPGCVRSKAPSTPTEGGASP